jgi:hypothetical protein
MRAKRDMSIVRAGCIAVVLLVIVSPAFAYPPDPDNAAVLYYQAFLLYDAPTSQALDDFVKGTTGPSEEVKECLQKGRTAISYALMATERGQCNWGLVYSRGFSLALPHLAQCRSLAKLLLADARLLAAEGNYREALERCLSTKRLARHVGDEMVISLLVAHAINGLADDCIRDILGLMSPDPQVLQWLKGQLMAVGTPARSFGASLKLEHEMFKDMIRMDRLDELTEALKGDGTSQVPAGLPAQIDEEFLAKNREYYDHYMTTLQATLAAPIPYAKKHAELKAMLERVTQEAGRKPDAVLTTVLVPALNRVLSIDAKAQARANALCVGVELLLAKAQTGALPERLPANMLKDPFSEQDYLYEKTSTGFVLRCQGKDLDKDTTYEYAFTVK